MGVEGFWSMGGLGLSGAGFLSLFSLILLENRLVIEQIFEYNRGMELGDPQQRRATSAVGWMWPSTTFEHSFTELDRHRRNRRT